jgi:hypothetical protein
MQIGSSRIWLQGVFLPIPSREVHWIWFSQTILVKLSEQTPYQASWTMTSYTQNLTSDQSSYNKNHGPSLYTTKLWNEDRPAKHQTHLIKYVQGQWLPSNQYVECLQETITKSAVKHIPQKRTKVKDSRPWINTEIRKNLRKLQRLYKQKKKTGDQNTKEK